jgi:hypothetical protein
MTFKILSKYWNIEGAIYKRLMLRDILSELYGNDSMTSNCLDGSDQLVMIDFSFNCYNDSALRCEAHTNYMRLRFPCSDGTDNPFPPSGRYANYRASQFT